MSSVDVVVTTQACFDVVAIDGICLRPAPALIKPQALRPMTIKSFFKTSQDPASRGIGCSHGERTVRGLEGILTSCASHPCILTGELLLPLASG